LQEGEKLMALTLTNRAQHMMIVELNNGESVYLTPGQTSIPIDESQINGNEKISKLTRVSALSINQPSNGDTEEDTTAEEETTVVEEARASGGGKGRRKG
jgi:hypothetical protein